MKKFINTNSKIQNEINTTNLLNSMCLLFDDKKIMKETKQKITISILPIDKIEIVICIIDNVIYMYFGQYTSNR